ncbi:MAG: succinate dehydrogenase assembly factor 2 [Rhizobiaceae bacterium]
MVLDPRRKQIIYRANHRGIKEMDILLGRYASDFVESLTEEELVLLELIMDESDRDLLTWFTGEVTVPDRHQNAVFEAIRSHQRRSV